MSDPRQHLEHDIDDGATTTVTRHYRRAPGGWWWGALALVPLMLAVLSQIGTGAPTTGTGQAVATVTVTASTTATVTGTPTASPTTTTATPTPSGSGTDAVTAAALGVTPEPTASETPTEATATVTVTPTATPTATTTRRARPIACDSFSRDVAGMLGSSPITFAPGGAQLTESSRRTIGDVASAMTRCGRVAVVTGHTDNTGTPAENKAISDARAAAVRAALAADGVPEGRIASVGAGADRPIASNADDAGRSKNRRVDIVVN